MTERPILFSGPMVRAILDGTKTQTRRVLKKQPLDVIPCLDDWVGEKWAALLTRDPEPHGTLFRCRYGVPGDRLWVRETFATNTLGCPNGLTYRADHLDMRGDGPANPIKWHPSIHMPRWASRITLEIVSVRVERVQDISTADIITEGLSTTLREYDAECHLREQFETLWDSINGDKSGRSWADNPWVWCIEFRRLP